jgi:hypothetical protein
MAKSKPGLGPRNVNFGDQESGGHSTVRSNVIGGVLNLTSGGAG